MDDPHREDAPVPAEGQVLWNQFLDLARTEGVQVEDPVNGEVDNSIVVPILTAFSASMCGNPIKKGLQV